MKPALIASALGAALVFAAGSASAAAPAPPQWQTPNPNYTSIVMEMPVNKPAKAVWARVGKYCDIGEWFGVACTLTSGKDGELGTVRDLANGAVLEILVAKTELSYTYTQPVRVGRPYDLYHGTIEARPVTATTSKLIYSLVFDNSSLPDAAAREKDTANRRARFTDGLKNMKILAEGGKLPPPAPPAPR